MAAEARDVLFGVAGWSYPDWQGIVYPRGCKDTLRAVAERVDVVEINNTFYRPPSAKNCASWARRTEDLGTFFTAKLPREFTHARTFDPAFVTEVRDGFAPLFESGRLLGVLAQFNYEFEYGTAAVDLMARIADAFAGRTQVFAEVRHASWNQDAALDALRGLGVAVLDLDYPGFASGFARDVAGVNGESGVAYFRLHGRNPAWFRKGAGRDQVYDWEYSPREVQQIEARIERIGAGAARTIVVANNHFEGKAMKLVEQLVAWYRESRPAG
ncbi:MAG: DUF72 domain-containing protein [Planctomycetes bacterium]|nr:DUF72 domain-containing protein [Planctomycetota bacterium]